MSEELDPIPEVITDEVPEKKKSNTIIIIAAVVVVLCCFCVAVSAAGWYIWTNF